MEINKLRKWQESRKIAHHRINRNFFEPWAEDNPTGSVEAFNGSKERMLPESPELLENGIQREAGNGNGTDRSEDDPTGSVEAFNGSKETESVDVAEVALPSADVVHDEAEEGKGTEVQAMDESEAEEGKGTEVQAMDESDFGVSGVEVSEDGSSAPSPCPSNIADADEQKNEEVEEPKAGTSGSVSGASSPTPEGEQKWEVETILDYSKDSSGDMYLVKWKNWESEFNTWEPAANVAECDTLLLEFYLLRKTQMESASEQKAEFTVTANGQKRRKRSSKKLQLPPDPRPIEVRAREFYENTLYPGQEEIKLWRLMWENLIVFERTKRGRDTIRWPAVKLTKTLEEGAANKLSEDQNEKLRGQLLFRQFDEERAKSKQILKEWETEINYTTEGKPTITVENEVDSEGPPENFFFVNDYVTSAGITIPDDPPLGCVCSGSCYDNRKECCPGGLFPYTRHRKLRVEMGTPIYECNKKCSCGPECANRVVQDGRDALIGSKFCIFRTSNGCGWGVKSLKSIKKGSFVTLYVGEVINTDEAERRGQEYDAEGCTYLFDLDFNEGDCLYTVDAAKFGNIAHFINHSCDPNLGVSPVWVNCLDPDLPKIALFALRDIPRGEELCFDYKNRNNKEPKLTAPVCPTFDFTVETLYKTEPGTAESTDSSSAGENTAESTDSSSAGENKTEKTGENGTEVASTASPQKTQPEKPKKNCLCGSVKCRKVLF